MGVSEGSRTPHKGGRTETPGGGRDRAIGTGAEQIVPTLVRMVGTNADSIFHVFLNTAMKANDLAPSDVELLNQRMPDAVTSFISGAVPAVALWVPFNITVRDNVPGAK